MLKDIKPTNLLDNYFIADFVKWGESREFNTKPEISDGYSYKAYEHVRGGALFEWDYEDIRMDSVRYHILKIYLEEVHNKYVSGFMFKDMDKSIASILSEIKYNA